MERSPRAATVGDNPAREMEMHRAKAVRDSANRAAANASVSVNRISSPIFYAGR
jgi:hypothetical protein